MPSVDWSALRRAANFWRAPALAWLGPDCVGVALAGEVPVVRALDGASDGSVEARFSAAANTLMEYLEQRRWPGGRLRLLGSDYWSRAVLLPMQGSSPTDDELDRLLAHTLEQTYGKSMEGWTRRWDRGEAESLAIAWPLLPLEQLQARLRARGGVLDEAIPLSAQLVQTLRNEAADGWMVAIETACRTIVRCEPAGFRSWRTLPGNTVDGDENDTSDLLQALNRERARLDDRCQQLLVFDLRPGGRARWQRPQVSGQFAAAQWHLVPRDAAMGAFSQLCSALQGAAR